MFTCVCDCVCCSVAVHYTRFLACDLFAHVYYYCLCASVCIICVYVYALCVCFLCGCVCILTSAGRGLSRPEPLSESDENASTTGGITGVQETTNWTAVLCHCVSLKGHEDRTTDVVLIQTLIANRSRRLWTNPSCSRQWYMVIIETHIHLYLENGI